ncbi:MAG: hypothetical protein KF878_23455 [Planctomycetes bacterium]|nr:hypothetical protein [Planctomycetota bacterium]
MTGTATNSATKRPASLGLACGVVLALLAVLAQVLLPAVHAWTCRVAAAEHCAVAHAADVDCLDALACVDPDHRHGPTIEVGHGDAAHAACATCAALQHLNPSPDLAPAVVATAAIVGDALRSPAATTAGRDASVHGARAPPLA